MKKLNILLICLLLLCSRTGIAQVKRIDYTFKISVNNITETAPGSLADRIDYGNHTTNIAGTTDQLLFYFRNPANHSMGRYSVYYNKNKGQVFLDFLPDDNVITQRNLYNLFYTKVRLHNGNNVLKIAIEENLIWITCNQGATTGELAEANTTGEGVLWKNDPDLFRDASHLFKSSNVTLLAVDSFSTGRRLSDSYEDDPVYDEYGYDEDDPAHPLQLGNGLDFDGVNDYVAVQNGSTYPAGNNSYTLEAWIKPSVHVKSGIIGWGNWGTTGQTNVLRLFDNNTVRNSWYGAELTVPSGNLADGAWHHVAASFDGTTRKIYIDGVLKGQDNPTGHNVTKTNNISLGRVNTDQYFNGKMDEVRVWNRALSQDEIQADKNLELNGNDSGLVAYYTFDQGTACDTNTGVSLLADVSGNGNTGTLTGFGLTGDASNWVRGVVPPSYDTICVGSTTTIEKGFINGAWSSSNTAVATVSNTGRVTGLGAGTAVISYTISDAADNGCPFVSAAIVTVNTQPAIPVISGNALGFDGVDDYVAVRPDNNYPAGNDKYTLEAWVKPDVHSSKIIIAWGNRGTTNETNVLRLGDNYTVRNGWYETELSAPSGNLADGAWHHIAVTFDDTVRKIYLDGVVIGQDNPTGHNVTRTDNVYIGGLPGEGDFFSGKLDEVRVWNVARTAAQIQSAMYTELPADEPGLVAGYSFNIGVAGAANAGKAEVPDNTNNHNNGILHNFSLNGTASNWVAGAPVYTCAARSNGLDFDGFDDYVAIQPDNNYPAGNDKYTLEAWVKPDVHTSDVIIGWGNRGTTNETNVLRLGDNYTVRNGWYITELAAPSGNLADGAWHHIAVTFDDTVRKIYLDGVVIGQDTPTGHNVTRTDNVYIGGLPGEGDFYDGKMDEVRVWNLARTQAEIRAAMLHELTGTEPGLIAYYRFNQGAADDANAGVTDVTDKTGSANNGTLMNFDLTGTASNWTVGYAGNMGNTICAGGNLQLTASAPGGTWSSSDPAVANVSSAGVVTGVSTGTASVTYTSNNGGGCTANAAVDVNVGFFPPPLAPITYVHGSATTTNNSSNIVANASISDPEPSFTMCVNSVLQLYDATPGGVWSSSDDNIATVSSSGLVTPVSSEGMAHIYYSVTSSSGCISTNSVNVYPVYSFLPIGMVEGYSQGGPVSASTINTIYGWAYDYSDADLTVPVSVYVTAGSGPEIFVTQIIAGEIRNDLLFKYDLPTSNHGFHFTIPSQYLNGVNYTFRFYTAGSSLACGEFHVADVNFLYTNVARKVVSGAETGGMAPGKIIVYPNPNNGFFKVAFTLGAPAPVSFRITDMQGRVVYSESEEAAAGMQTYDLAPKNLAPGVYFLKIDTREFSGAGKVTVE